MNPATHELAHVFIELGLATIGMAILARLSSRWGFSAIPLYLLAGLPFGNGGIDPLSCRQDHERRHMAWCGQARLASGVSMDPKDGREVRMTHQRLGCLRLRTLTNQEARQRLPEVVGAKPARFSARPQRLPLAADGPQPACLQPRGRRTGSVSSRSLTKTAGSPTQTSIQVPLQPMRRATQVARALSPRLDGSSPSQ